MYLHNFPHTEVNCFKTNVPCPFQSGPTHHDKPYLPSHPLPTPTFLAFQLPGGAAGLGEGVCLEGWGQVLKVLGSLFLGKGSCKVLA